ncbi:Membrane-bound transcription factor site-2 protease [Gaertneriomyces sp. JEL0708]|nr:Membrane-bound transcription factor site-2 protease [Gaertneriomyces sp. JEL0708]
MALLSRVAWGTAFDVFTWQSGSAPPPDQSFQAMDFRVNSSLLYSSGATIPEMTMGSGKLLVSLIPGLNLPFSAFIYYFMAFLVASIFHEIGHAIAASVEHVSIQSFGVFLYVMFPGAFVELREQSMDLLRPYNKLRVICAGVWHNATLTLAIWGLLWTLPYWLALGYETTTEGSGAVVLDIMKESPLRGHLKQGDMIMSVNGSPLTAGVRGWSSLLHKNLMDSASMQKGYCIPEKVRLAQDLRCCEVTEQEPLGPSDSAFQCFSLLDVQHQNRSHIPSEQLSCLPLHDIVVRYPECLKSSDCPNDSSATYCMNPYIPNAYIRIIRFAVCGSMDCWRGDSVKAPENITFLGDPREVWEGVRVGSIVPRLGIWPLRLPYMLERFLQFTLSVTVALAVLNMVPAFTLDGEHALAAFADAVLEYRYGNVVPVPIERMKSKALRAVTKCSAVLLICTIAVGLWGAISN